MTAENIAVMVLDNLTWIAGFQLLLVVAVIIGLYIAVKKIDDLRQEVWYLEDQMNAMQTYTYTSKDCWK